ARNTPVEREPGDLFPAAGGAVDGGAADRSAGRGDTHPRITRSGVRAGAPQRPVTIRSGCGSGRSDGGTWRGSEVMSVIVAVPPRRRADAQVIVSQHVCPIAHFSCSAGGRRCECRRGVGGASPDPAVLWDTEPMRAGEVSEVSQDYLKAIWSAQEWGGDPMTATELANRFGTTKANVTEVLKRLDELELIKRVPYRPPVLTA